MRQAAAEDGGEDGAVLLDHVHEGVESGAELPVDDGRIRKRVRRGGGLPGHADGYGLYRKMSALRRATLFCDASERGDPSIAPCL